METIALIVVTMVLAFLVFIGICVVLFLSFFGEYNDPADPEPDLESWLEALRDELKQLGIHDIIEYKIAAELYHENKTPEEAALIIYNDIEYND